MEQLLKNSTEQFNSTLLSLGWTEDYLSKTRTLKICPFDQNHWVPEDVASKHEQYCALRQRGYLPEEIAVMPPDVQSTGMDEIRSAATNAPIVPWELDLDAFSTSKQKRMRMVECQTPDGHGMSIEQLAMMRDSKRRRQSYRGIHTARLSYTEILREIIKQQTELLQARCGRSSSETNIPFDSSTSKGTNRKDDDATCHGTSTGDQRASEKHKRHRFREEKQSGERIGRGSPSRRRESPRKRRHTGSDRESSNSRRQESKPHGDRKSSTHRHHHKHRHHHDKNST
ncbi:unnamed protein product [Calicophoron daubneyi]|uniref:Uncharacterized protein n=1 Tax=Calicophoron daubneyi TaxID=300641 RepID=A0AAV2TZI0_CALDB